MLYIVLTGKYDDLYNAGLKYGDGNLGTKGMALFFHSHECNEICHALGLEQFDLSQTENDSVILHHASTVSI